MRIWNEISFGKQLISGIHRRRADRARSKRKLAVAHYFYSLAARNGDPEACFQLGKNYLHGIGCARSGSEAVFWFRRSAEAGHVDGQFELGIALLGEHGIEWTVGESARWAMANTSYPKKRDLLYPEGINISRDEAEAFRWLGKAAEAGKAEAQANIGWMLLSGQGCTTNRAEAQKWFESAAKVNISQAALGLSECFGQENSTNFDSEASFSWLKRASELGSPAASYKIAMRLLNEPKEQRDPVAIGEYLKSAASKGHLSAQLELGRLILASSSTAEDIEIALQYIRTSAKSGHVEAAVLLGDLLSKGNRVRPDLREAATWYRQAADKGHVEAQFQIACLFARGDGVPKDLVFAARYFEASAKKGHAIAALNIGIFYEQGEGVEQNFDLARYWVEIAATSGVAQAQVRLAHILSTGRFGQIDQKLLQELLEKAALQKNTDGEVALAVILLNEEQRDFQKINHLLSSAISKGHLGAIELTLVQGRRLIELTQVAEQAIHQLQTKVASMPPRATVLLAIELLRGRFVPGDRTQAEALLRQERLMTDASAQFELGVLYCDRKSSDQDLAMGLECYIRAAESGHPIAQYNAGVMLAKGMGAERDLIRASNYLIQAAAQGLEKANAFLATLTESRGPDNVNRSFPSR